MDRIIKRQEILSKDIAYGLFFAIAGIGLTSSDKNLILLTIALGLISVLYPVLLYFRVKSYRKLLISASVVAIVGIDYAIWNHFKPSDLFQSVRNFYIASVFVPFFYYGLRCVISYLLAAFSLSIFFIIVYFSGFLVYEYFNSVSKVIPLNVSIFFGVYLAYLTLKYFSYKYTILKEMRADEVTDEWGEKRESLNRESPHSAYGVEAEFSDTQYGSDDDKRVAGAKGENLVREQLTRMKGVSINGWISTGNTFFNGKNFEIDFLIMVPNFGFVIAEVKYYSGSVYCNGTDEWSRLNKHTGQYQNFKNASKQVIRTCRLLKSLLKSEELDNWAVKSVVVFSHPESHIYRGIGKDEPQTDVIQLTELESFIKNLPSRDSNQFSKNDSNKIQAAFQKYQKKYFNPNAAKYSS